MRLFVSVALLGLLVAVPAMAQNTYTTTNTGTAPGPVLYAVPMYNGVSGATQYQTGVNGAPIYNNASQQPLPLNQMAAGKNAPSYNYNNTNQAYTGFMGGNPLAGADLANLSPEQRRLIDQQAAARAAQEQAYLTSLQQQQAQQQGQMNPYLQGANQMYNNFNQPEQKPKQRRVVYNERNNPLTTPPRLFNPDQ